MHFVAPNLPKLSLLRKVKAIQILNPHQSSTCWVVRSACVASIPGLIHHYSSHFIPDSHKSTTQPHHTPPFHVETSEWQLSHPEQDLSTVLVLPLCYPVSSQPQLEGLLRAKSRSLPAIHTDDTLRFVYCIHPYTILYLSRACNAPFFSLLDITDIEIFLETSESKDVIHNSCMEAMISFFETCLGITVLATDLEQPASPWVVQHGHHVLADLAGFDESLCVRNLQMLLRSHGRIQVVLDTRPRKGQVLCGAGSPSPPHSKW